MFWYEAFLSVVCWYEAFLSVVCWFLFWVGRRRTSGRRQARFSCDEWRLSVGLALLSQTLTKAVVFFASGTPRQSKRQPIVLARGVVVLVGRDAVARRQFCILCVYGWSMLINVDYANRCRIGSLVAHPVWANCRSSSCAPSTLTGFQLPVAWRETAVSAPYFPGCVRAFQFKVSMPGALLIQTGHLYYILYNKKTSNKNDRLKITGE